MLLDISPDVACENSYAVTRSEAATPIINMYIGKLLLVPVVRVELHSLVDPIPYD